MKECAMKECGCINSYSIYPCGHEYNTWEYCAKAKARNLLSCGPPTCCPSRKRIMVPPNLEETCGSTCLTRPFQCGHCGAPKQLGWRCARCHYLRGMGTWLWDQCPGCLELGPLDPKFGLCGKCKRGRGPSGRSLPCLDKAKPALSWKCHKCARAVRTEVGHMTCSGTAGCGHKRCGQCNALFACSCKCGCTNTFVEGGHRPCDWCVRSCLNR